MTSAVTVRHNFETGHRLPFLGGKCASLHGHSWWAEVTVTAPSEQQVVVEFGEFKKALRRWIDDHLDHGLMLGDRDPLADTLAGHGKLYRFGTDEPSSGLQWPTVENVARLLARVGAEALDGTSRAPRAAVTRVVVSETHVNRAEWTV